VLKQTIAILALAGALASQSMAQDKAPAAAPRAAASKPGAASASRVDTVIDLVKGGLSEGMVIKTLQRENKPINLTTADMLKLQKAGVSETIMDVMTDPKAAAKPTVAAAAPASASVSSAPAITGQATPFPAALAGASSGPHKRRLAVKSFDYATVRTWVHYWFNSDVNIGDGIRAMLTARMAQSKNITLLERAKVADALGEQDFGATNRVAQGTKAKIGKVSGADAILYGDITIFGRDDKKSSSGIMSNLPGPLGRAGGVHKEDKAVVAIALRIVDAETLEVLETGEARGESKRTSNNWGALVAGNGKIAAGGADMTSSNFEQTIIGEATSDAVTKIVALLEERISRIPEKSRSIEGRVANIEGNQMMLTVGANDAVMVGDRFEIHQITSVLLDPETKQEIDKVTVKVGEFVVRTVRDKSSIGEYGGQPVSAAYMLLQGKGYAARMMAQ
jgi:curli biogenesis system outer membrane secretion channel CsgG